MTDQKVFRLVNGNATSIKGIIEPLDRHEAFEIIAELTLIDLQKLFSMHLNEPVKVQMFFSDQEYMKIFCKLILALISDINRKLYFETHT